MPAKARPPHRKVFLTSVGVAPEEIQMSEIRPEESVLTAFNKNAAPAIFPVEVSEKCRSCTQ